MCKLGLNGFFFQRSFGSLKLDNIGKFFDFKLGHFWENIIKERQGHKLACTTPSDGKLSSAIQSMRLVLFCDDKHTQQLQHHKWQWQQLEIYTQKQCHTGEMWPNTPLCHGTDVKKQRQPTNFIGQIDHDTNCHPPTIPQTSVVRKHEVMILCEPSKWEGATWRARMGGCHSQHIQISTLHMYKKMPSLVSRACYSRKHESKPKLLCYWFLLKWSFMVLEQIGVSHTPLHGKSRGFTGGGGFTTRPAHSLFITSKAQCFIGIHGCRQNVPGTPHVLCSWYMTSFFLFFGLETFSCQGVPKQIVFCKRAPFWLLWLSGFHLPTNHIFRSWNPP